MDKEQFSRNITWSVMAKKPPHWKRSIIGRARLLRLCTISWSVNGNWCVNTDKSRYIMIPEFNNCFIIVSPNLFPYFNHSLTAQGSVCHLSHETVVTTTTIICMQLFAGCVVGSRLMKMKKKLNCSELFHLLIAWMDFHLCDRLVDQFTVRVNGHLLLLMYRGNETPMHETAQYYWQSSFTSSPFYQNCCDQI